MNDFYQYLSEVWLHTKIAATSFMMATLMAVFRTKAQYGRVDLLESIMCGLFAIGIWSFLDWFHIPQTASVGLASAIGYFGTHWLADFIKEYLQKGVKK
ncbi:phage holin family protein [Moraxella sp. Pampa]|uniref:phage holin family protein n=1 Tax=Moraxella sp. Pampa TaxID=3111978 RepID=UPI002B416500|nr:phage holin family protein [Moraxella sp. Pampa]